MPVVLFSWELQFSIDWFECCISPQSWVLSYCTTNHINVFSIIWYNWCMIITCNWEWSHKTPFIPLRIVSFYTAQCSVAIVSTNNIDTSVTIDSMNKITANQYRLFEVVLWILLLVLLLLLLLLTTVEGDTFSNCSSCNSNFCTHIQTRKMQTMWKYCAKQWNRTCRQSYHQTFGQTTRKVHWLWTCNDSISILHSQVSNWDFKLPKIKLTCFLQS